MGKAIQSLYSWAGMLSVLLFLCGCTSLDNNDIQGNSDNRKLLSLEIEKYQQTLTDDPGSHRAYLALGWSLLDKGEYNQAVQNFNQALQADPTNETAFMGLGIAYEHLQNFSYAKDCYMEVIKRNPDWHFAYYQLGRILKQAGDKENALKMLNHLVNHDTLLAKELMNYLYD